MMMMMMMIVLLLSFSFACASSAKLGWSGSSTILNENAVLGNILKDLLRNTIFTTTHMNEKIIDDDDDDYLQRMNVKKREKAIVAAEKFLLLNNDGQKYTRNELQPVVILPGFLSSALMSELIDADVPDGCPSNLPEYQSWLNIAESTQLRCYLNQFSRHYENGTYSISEGISFWGKDFGGVDGIDNLAANVDIPVFRVMIEALETIGYQRNVNIHGAPYDFTFPGYHYDRNGYFDALTQLIEDTYARNNNNTVHLIGHSMGTVMLHYFLTTRDQVWKDRFVASYIPIAGVWYGCPFATRALITGITNGDFNKWFIRNLIRGWGSVHWFIPSPNWTPKLWVSTPDRDYYTEDLVQLFIDANLPDVAEAFPLANAQTSKMQPVGRPLHCITGSGFPTEVSLNYTTTDWYETPIIIREDGDGLVPTESSSSCELLSPTTRKDYPGRDHINIISDDEVLSGIQ